ncbi:MAG: hypothetical protein ACLTSX_12370 [Collinsella sp.]
MAFLAACTTLHAAFETHVMPARMPLAKLLARWLPPAGAAGSDVAGGVGEAWALLRVELTPEPMPLAKLLDALRP